MVIYFTGTGNSQFVAEALADQLHDKIECANTYMKKNKRGDFTSKKPYVFVFPIYLSSMAEVFADFIKNSEFAGCDQAYFVATCASAMGATPNVASKLCKQKGLTFMGAAKIVMPQNYIVLFAMTGKDEIKRRIDNCKQELSALGEIIAKRGFIDSQFSSAFEYGLIKLVEKLYNGPCTKTKQFYATDSCSHCGLCEKTCPMNNIKMQDGKPMWIKSCTHCMACINRCPKAAIEYGKNTVGKPRYVCEKYKPEVME